MAELPSGAVSGRDERLESEKVRSGPPSDE